MTTSVQSWSQRILRQRGPSAQGGFSLIELMIVVAVVAILVAIAYPSYNESVRKSRRAQAKADLVEAAQIAERFHTVNNTYVGLTTTGTTPQIIGQSPKTGTANYRIAIANLAAGTFTLSATPVAGTDQANDRCGTLRLNQAGLRQHSAGNVVQCQFGVRGP